MFCGVEDLDDSTVPIIDEKVNDLRKPGIYRQLFGSYKMTVCLNVLVGGISASEFFAPLLYTAQYAAIQRRSDIHRLELAFSWKKCPVSPLIASVRAPGPKCTCSPLSSP